MTDINWTEVETKVFFWVTAETSVQIHWEITYRNKKEIIVAPMIPKLDTFDRDYYLRESFKLAKPNIKEWVQSVQAQTPTTIVNQVIQWNPEDWEDEVEQEDEVKQEDTVIIGDDGEIPLEDSEMLT